MKHVYSAGIIVYRMHNNMREYLLLHYPHGHWDFPKGKIETGEQKPEAAARELREETGLNAAIINGFEEHVTYVFHESGQLVRKTVYFFVGTVVDKVPVTLSDEHVGYQWLSFEQAMHTITYATARDILQQAEQFLLSI